jgi:hypothetical protein
LITVGKPERQWSDRAAARLVRFSRRVRLLMLPLVLLFVVLAGILPFGTANKDFAHDLKTQTPFYATVTAVGHHFYDGDYVDVSVDGKTREVDYPDDIPGVRVGDEIEVVEEPDDPTHVLSTAHDVTDHSVLDILFGLMCAVLAVLTAGTYFVVPRRGHRAMRRTRTLAPATLVAIRDTGRVRRSWRGIGDLFYRRYTLELDVDGQPLVVHGVRFRDQTRSLFPWVAKAGDRVRVSLPARPGDWVVVVSAHGQCLMPTAPASAAVSPNSP